MNSDTLLLLTAIALAVWLPLTPLYLFARRYRVARFVFIGFPAASRAWFSLLALVLLLPCLAFFSSFALPGWLKWFIAAWIALQTNCFPGLWRQYREISSAKRGEKPRYPMAPKELFISYNRETAELARAIWQRLEALGVPVWFGERELLVEGRDSLDRKGALRTVLRHGLLTSHRCIALVSARAFHSDYVAGFEWAHFDQREQREGAPLVLPVLVGPELKLPANGLPAFLSPPAQPTLNWIDGDDLDSLVRQLLDRAGLADRFRPQVPQPYVGPLETHSFDIKTTSRHGLGRVMTCSVQHPPTWRMTRGPIPNQFITAVCARTGMHMNLIVGPMSDDAVAALRNLNPADVEHENIYASKVFAMMRVLSMGVRTRSLLASHLFNLRWIGGQAPTLKNKNGAPLLDAAGRPMEASTRQHLAFTYRSMGAFHRKYVVLVRPGPLGDPKHFEFVFTCFLPSGPNAGWEHFLDTVPEVDAIVHTLEVA